MHHPSFNCNSYLRFFFFFLHSSLNYSLNKEAFQWSFNIFSQGIMCKEGPEKQTCIFNYARRFHLFCWPLLLYIIYTYYYTNNTVHLHLYIKELLFSHYSLNTLWTCMSEPTVMGFNLMERYLSLKGVPCLIASLNPMTHGMSSFCLQGKHVLFCKEFDLPEEGGPYFYLRPNFFYKVIEPVHWESMVGLWFSLHLTHSH